MNYPLISEYIEAIKLAEDNFDQLSSLRPVLDSYGNPVMSSGNFAVVFKMKDIDTGKLYAVKCFIKDQEGRNESYAMIADELKNVNSPYILPIRFLEKELFVDTSQSDETEFPVLVMDWVDGKTLDAYLREILDNQYRLQMLAYHFCQMAAWLLVQPFAHGDLKPDNILVREDGSLVLVDYDGFYVPAMAGMEARELGSPDFRHPLRTSKDFNEHLDDFSIATIALSLKAISLDRQLYHTFAASDRLLLSATDYRDIGNSAAMQKIMQLASDSELSTLLSAFYMVFALKMLDKSHSKAFEIKVPTIIVGEGKTILTKEDVKQATEKYGELVNVVIADTVTKIRKWAFSRCNRLISIFIPSSVTEIDLEIFSYCNELTSIIIDKENEKYDSRDNCNAIIETWTNTLIVGCKNTIIPDYVSKIGKSAFSNCIGLTSIFIPDSVEIISGWAFSRCSALSSIIISDSVTMIGTYAFSDCSSLKSIDIPNSVVVIGRGAFFRCNGLKSIVIPDSVTDIGPSAFYGCTSLSSINIPESVKRIGYRAFSCCNSLSTISVDNENKWFDSRDNCNAIIIKATNTLIMGCKYTIIPNSVTKIGNDAFFNCSSLISMKIPNSVTEIGENAFSGCSSLISIIIPNSITEIGLEVLSDCSKLTSIIVDNENEKFDSRDNCNAIIEKGTNILIAGCKNTIIPNTVTTIGACAFSGCTGLTSIIIPDSVTTIGVSSFYGCNSLLSIIILSSVSQIDYDSFYGCSSLISIVVDSKNMKYDSRDNCNAIIESDTNRLILGCKNTIIPNTVTTIGASAFYQCRGLTSIIIPDSVIKINPHAFSCCSNLTSISIPYSVTEISEDSFNSCTNLTSVKILNSAIKIYESTFCNCFNLIKIVIPKGSKQKFKRLLPPNLHSKLEDSAIEMQTIIIGEGKNIVTKEDVKQAKELYGDLVNVEIANSVTEIEEGAFYGCSNLTSLKIPNSVNEIGCCAFYSCCGLTSITIPNSVSIISCSSFQGCSHLKSLTILSHKTEIWAFAFMDCTELTSINFLNSVADIGGWAFHNCNNLNEIIIPRGTRQEFEEMLDEELHSKLVEK